MNVWIGAKRKENSNQFVWNNGKTLNFTNWDVNSPTEQTSRKCVQIQSNMGREFSDEMNVDSDLISGKWKDVTCEFRNLFVCQKYQTWSFPQLQIEFLDMRQKLEDTMFKLHYFQEKFDESQRNPGQNTKLFEQFL